jgi:hypothetical protein
VLPFNLKQNVHKRTAPIGCGADVTVLEISQDMKLYSKGDTRVFLR